MDSSFISTKMSDFKAEAIPVVLHLYPGILVFLVTNKQVHELVYSLRIPPCAIIFACKSIL